jgi:hypothetical protein
VEQVIGSDSLTERYPNWHCDQKLSSQSTAGLEGITMEIYEKQRLIIVNQLNLVEDVMVFHGNIAVIESHTNFWIW